MDSSSFYILLTFQIVTLVTGVIGPLLSTLTTFVLGIRRSSCLGGELVRTKSLTNLSGNENPNFSEIADQLKVVIEGLQHAKSFERRT